MTSIISAEPGHAVVIATVDWDGDETPLIIEERTWSVLAWRQRKHQSRLEPVTLVDLPGHGDDFHWSLVTCAWSKLVGAGIVLDREGSRWTC